jgi:hypothetical protein
MLFVQNKSQKTIPGDIIAFIINDDFIGYGKVVTVCKDEALINEDASVREEMERIKTQGGSCDIEIV